MAHRMQVVHGAEAWGQGCEDAPSQGGLDTCAAELPNPPAGPRLPSEQTQLQANADEKERALCQHPAGKGGTVGGTLHLHTGPLIGSFTNSSIPYLLNASCGGHCTRDVGEGCGQNR